MFKKLDKMLERFENNFCDDEDIAMLKKALDEMKE